MVTIAAANSSTPVNLYETVTTATVTTTALQQDWHFDQWFYNLIWQTNISGAAGFVSGGVGSTISSGISSAIDGFWGATLGGGAAGAFGGAVGYTGSYLSNYAATGFDKSYLDGKEYFGGLGRSVLTGGGIGGAMNGMIYTADWIGRHYCSGGNDFYELPNGGDPNAVQVPDRPSTEIQRYGNNKLLEVIKDKPQTPGSQEWGVGVNKSFWNGKPVAKVIPGSKWGGHAHFDINYDYQVHTHWGGSEPGAGDFATARKNNLNSIRGSYGIYVPSNNGQFFGYNSWAETKGYKAIYWLMK